MRKQFIVFIPLLLGLSSSISAQNFSKITEAKNPNNYVYDNFGLSVAIHQDIAVVGNPGDDVVNNNNNQHFSNSAMMQQDPIGSGSAYVYEKDANNNWIMAQQLTASDERDSSDFGYTCAVSGTTIVVGAPTAQPAGYNWPYSGAVYVFNKVGNAFQEVQKIEAPIAGGNRYFGYSVALYGDNLAIGAPGDGTDEQGNYTNGFAGAVYLYRLVNGTWTFNRKLTGTNRLTWDNYGKSIKINANDIVIRYKNNYDIYNIGANGNATLQTANQLTFNQWEDGKYASMAINKEYLAMGFTDVSYTTNSYCMLCGEVLVYKKDGNNVWKYLQTIRPSAASAMNKYGFSVALDENTLAIRYEGNSKIDLFEMSGGLMVFKNSITLSGSFLNAGESMALSANTLVVDDAQYGGGNTGTPYSSGRVLFYTSTDIISTAVEENKTTGVTIYPNPSNSEFTLSRSEVKDIVIYNELGQAEHPAISKNFVTSFKGLLIVEITTTDGKKVREKMIVY